LLLRYLAANARAERIHILCCSAGARIVSQALHEPRPGTCATAPEDVGVALKIGRVVFAALHWALGFLGWPCLGAPGEPGLGPEDFPSVPWFQGPALVNVSGAEEAASGNGHGYFS